MSVITCEGCQEPISAIADGYWTVTTPRDGDLDFCRLECLNSWLAMELEKTTYILPARGETPVPLYNLRRENI